MKIIPTLSKKNYNVSQETEEKYLLRFLLWIIWGLIILYVLFYWVALFSLRFISLEQERKWFSSGWIVFDEKDIAPVPEYIQKRYELLPYQLYILKWQWEVNAFTTLGWNIFLTEEFLEEVRYVETLDFIVGHEIGHVEHRDVLKSIIPSLPIHVLLSLFWVKELSSLFTGLVENQLSKSQETKADYYGLDFTYSLNGHVGCALDLFETDNSVWKNVIEVFSTHPMTTLRIERAKKYIETMQYPKLQCKELNIEE